jgi:hypothetical protein
MEALATYEQSFAGTRRQFLLYADHVAVHGRRFRSTFDVRYELATLSAQIDSARVRAPLFYGGLALIGIALLGLGILVFQGGLIMPALIVVGVTALLGIACVIIRPRPLRVFMFKQKDGNYAFEIIGAGRDAGLVEQFAASVAEQIRKAHVEV